MTSIYRNVTARYDHVSNQFSVNSALEVTRNGRYSQVMSAGLPTLQAYGIARDNRSTVQKYYNASNMGNPTGALAATTAFWIAKVKTNGAWDYKNVSGYAPYNKQWNAVQKRVAMTRTSEWFGNYNYGFTGSALYTQGILLTGGDIVSLKHNHVPDSYSDKQAIKTGYQEATQN